MKVTLPPHYKEEADLFEKQLKRHSVKLKNAGHTYLLDLYKFCIKPHDDLGVRANPSENRSKKSSLEAMEHAQALNQGIREIGDTNKEKYILQQLRSAINRLAYLIYALKDDEYLRYMHDGRTSSPFSTQRKKLKGDSKKLEALAKILKKRYIRDAFVGMTTVYMDYIATLEYSEVQGMVFEILQNGNITTPYDHKNSKKIRDYFFLTLSNGSTNFPFSPQITQEYLGSFMRIKDEVEDEVEDPRRAKKEATENEAEEIEKVLSEMFPITAESEDAPREELKKGVIKKLANYLAITMSDWSIAELKGDSMPRDELIAYLKGDLDTNPTACLIIKTFLDLFNPSKETKNGSASTNTVVNDVSIIRGHLKLISKGDLDEKISLDIKEILDKAGITVPPMPVGGKNTKVYKNARKDLDIFYIENHDILKGIENYKDNFAHHLPWVGGIMPNPSRLGQRAKNLYLDESLNSRSILAKVSTTKQPSVISNIQSAGSCVSNLVLAFHDENMKNFRLLKSHKTLTIEGTKGDEEAKVKGLAMLQGAGIIYYALVIMALDHLMTVDAEELWKIMEDELDARVGYKSNPEAKLAENFTNLDLRKEVVRKSYLQYMYQKLAV